MQLELVACFAILVALVIVSTVDMAYSHLSDLSLRRLSSDTPEDGRASTYEFLRQILDNRPLFRFALSSTIQILVIAFTLLVVMIIIEFTLDRTSILLYGLLIGLSASVIFRQLLPRLIVRRDPEGILLFALPIVKPLYSLIALIVAPFSANFRSKEQQKLEATQTPDTAEDKEDDDEDFQALLEVGEAEGIIEENEREMIESMVEFAETRVGEIMTPRTEICSIAYDATIREARDLMIEQKYSRIPVFRESVDNIEGIIYVRDLLQVWAAGEKENAPITSLLREPYYVPETKSASELLRSMQGGHLQLAIVVDEYGGVAGVISIEDLIEEIVGEIEDEDTEEEEIIEIIQGEDGYFDVLGSTEVDKIERLFDVELEDDDYTTIAGMVTSELGHVPKAGETFSIRGIQIEVLEADEKRVNLLRLRREVEAAGDEAAQ